VSRLQAVGGQNENCRAGRWFGLRAWRPSGYDKGVNQVKKLRVGVLGSGKGSNLVAIADACAAGHIPAEIVLVISDVADAGILDRARERGLRAEHLPPGKFKTKLDEVTERVYVQRLLDAQVELLALAGYMRILKGEFLRAFPLRVVNIHPSLLPSFPGLEAWKQALDYGVKVTGCTVHFVDAGVDTGPIIGQEAVPVQSDDTPASLHERIQQAERRLYPRVVGAIAEGRVAIRGRQTVWR
jgi:phosphoribosylglycinamide formyltransferase 1